MIRSMTGYGQGVAEAPGLKVTVELRSVNNRFADLKLRLPDDLMPFEHELRRKVLSTVKRGRVDIDLRLERSGRLIGDERSDFVDAGRQADQVETDSTQPSHSVGFRREAQALALQPLDDEVVDGGSDLRFEI